MARGSGGSSFAWTGASHGSDAAGQKRFYPFCRPRPPPAALGSSAGRAQGMQAGPGLSFSLGLLLREAHRPVRVSNGLVRIQESRSLE